MTASTMGELRAARDGARSADMVELRLDGVSDLDVAGALAGRRAPVVVTCRPVWEGGRFDGSEEERQRILLRALDLGAEVVDIEWRAIAGAPQTTPLARAVREHASRVLVSLHDFEGVPADLPERVAAMRATGASTIKVAVAAAHLTDTLPLIEVARGGGAVVVGMGDAGVPSRLLAAKYGSRWTYAGQAIAPGQIPAGQMLGEYAFRRVGAHTQLFGVVSTNALHSLSPALHNAAFEAAGLDAVYVPLPATSFEDFLAYADALGFEGVSVTIPFKLDALQAAMDADECTRRVGAANTLRRARAPQLPDSSSQPPRGRGEWRAGSRLCGVPRSWEAANTDVEGFLEPLEAALHMPLHGLRAAVVGAGGAARAVVVALQSRNVRVTVHARRAEQAREVAASLGARAGGWPPAPGSWDLLVNCTPLGGAGLRDTSPLEPHLLTGRVVCDLTYGPGESRLLRDARQAGCRTLDGLPMLIAQAERQFEWWIGHRPPAGVMEAAAHARLGIGALAR